MTIKKLRIKNIRLSTPLSVNDPIDLTESYTMIRDRNHSILQYRHIVQKASFLMNYLATKKRFWELLIALRQQISKGRLFRKSLAASGREVIPPPKAR